jgi:copper chaperone
MRANVLAYSMITHVRVEGMTCQHCVRAIFTALAGVEGVARADVRIGSVDVEHDGTVTIDQIRAAVEIAGYSIRDVETNRRALPLL